MAAEFTCSRGPIRAAESQAASNSPSEAIIFKECMLNSISIIPGSEDEVTASGHAMNWDAIRSVNGSPTQGNRARTFQMKVSNFLTELKRRKVYKVAVAYAFVSGY